MKRVVALACLVALLVVGADAAAPAEPAATTTVFRDSTGEDPAGPDVTAVTVTSDGTSLGFPIAIPTNASVMPDMRLRHSRARAGGSRCRCAC